MMGMIGFVVGVIGFLLHQLIEQIAEVKWDTTQDILKVSKITTGLGVVVVKVWVESIFQWV